MHYCLCLLDQSYLYPQLSGVGWGVSHHSPFPSQLSESLPWGPSRLATLPTSAPMSPPLASQPGPCHASLHQSLTKPQAP